VHRQHADDTHARQQFVDLVDGPEQFQFLEQQLLVEQQQFQFVQQ
jgi:hypothetical protein